MADIAVQTHATIPLIDLISARTTQAPLTLPVNGGAYMRMRHVEAIPSSGSGYSMWRLRALDSLIERLSRAQADQMRSKSPAERQAELLEEAARQIAEDNRRAKPTLGLSEGLLVDIFT